MISGLGRKVKALPRASMPSVGARLITWLTGYTMGGNLHGDRPSMVGAGHVGVPRLRHVQRGR